MSLTSQWHVTVAARARAHVACQRDAIGMSAGCSADFGAQWSPEHASGIALGCHPPRMRLLTVYTVSHHCISPPGPTPVVKASNQSRGCHCILNIYLSLRYQDCPVLMQMRRVLAELCYGSFETVTAICRYVQTTSASTLTLIFSASFAVSRESSKSLLQDKFVC
jgi:hypothetical protein